MCVRSAHTSVDGGRGKVMGLVIASKTSWTIPDSEYGPQNCSNPRVTTLSVQPNEHQGVDELVYFIVNKYKNYQIKFPKQNQKI